tara:strand:+ start:212 stop:739 length:528 start_codon:yes stop_codon:yes gene_type:complete
MAIANNYPMGTPKSDDLLIGTSVPAANSEDVATTRNFSISAVATLATQGYAEVTKDISNSQWLALAANSVEIIPAPGIGKVIQIILAHAKWVPSGDNFEFNQPLTLGNGTGGASVVVQGTMPNTNYTDIDGDSTYLFTISGAAASSNAAINFGCDNGATLTGGGTLSITVRYQVI